MRRSLISIFVAFAGLFAAGAQDYDGDAFVRQLQPRDSILIADQLSYGFALQGVADGSALALPNVKDTLMRDILIVNPWRIDTVKNHKKSATKDLELSLTITSFDEGEYLLPGLPVAIRRPSGDVDTLLFRGQDVLFCTMPVDTATFKINDIKAQMKYPLTFAEVWPWLLLALLVVALGVGIWLLVRRHRRLRQEAEHEDPPHIVALRKLDDYRGDKFWAPHRQKAFYSGVTDALREYISARYGFGAMEMTTAEIFNELKKIDMPAELKGELQELFERSDFVKFAKYVASDQENALVLPLSVRFVTTTYQEEIEGEGKNVL